MIDDIRRARQAGRVASDSLFTQQNRLRAKDVQIARVRRRGKEGVEEATALEREMASLKDAIGREQDTLRRLNVQLSDLVGTFVLPQSPQQVASQLEDRLPCVLFPLRVETRFMGNSDRRELWVRVYPDDIAVHTHEKALTRDEADAGIQYWTERALALSIDDEAERERRKKGAWRSLATSFGGTRASWIASEVKRRAIAAEGNEDFVFLLFRVQIAVILADPRLTPEAKRTAILSVLASAHPLLDLVRGRITAFLQADPHVGDDTRRAILRTIDEATLKHLGFEADELKPESWSRAPRTEVLPDRFVLIGFAGGVRREWLFPNTIPSPLILGPNPQNLESELAQRDGDLVVGDDYAWIWDFQKAIDVGMGVRAPLPEPFASQGFDRLLVLGLRVSSEPADHKELLEE
ncbi:MAG: hypothetical protein ACRD15_12450, partial [Vicinamibacterales bacterium]